MASISNARAAILKRFDVTVGQMDNQWRFDGNINTSNGPKRGEQPSGSVQAGICRRASQRSST